MRIAYLLDARTPCGIENHTFQLARGFRARGHDVRVWSSGDDLRILEPLRALPEFAELAVDAAGVHGGQPAGRLLRRSRALARAVRAWRPDVVHVQRGGPYTLKWPLCALWLRGGAPLVATDHDQLHAPAWKLRLLRGFDRAIARFIAVSEFSQGLMGTRYGRPATKVRCIHHGIDLTRFKPAAPGERARLRAAAGLPADATEVGYNGRLATEKGIDVLLEAAAQTLPRVPSALLAIAGSGPERAALEARAEALGLGGRVKFLGFVRDAAEYYRALDVLAMPSRYEAFGLVAAEAMASGVAVVATPAGGLREVLGDGDAGRVVPIDDAGALAAALTDLAGDPDARGALAARGLLRVRERYDQVRMLDATAAVYTEVVRRPGTASASTEFPATNHR